MIQDIAPHKYDVTYESITAMETDVILVFQKDSLLCHMDGSQITYPIAKELTEVQPEVLKEARFLFRIDDTAYFKLDGAKIAESAHWKYLPQKNLRDVRPLWKAFCGYYRFSDLSVVCGE